MRILFITHQFPPANLGGTEIYALSIAEELQKRGYQVQVLYPEYDLTRPEGTVTEDVHEGLAVARMNIHPGPSMVSRFLDEKTAAALGTYLAGLEIDMVHFHHLIGFSTTAVRTCKELGIPVVMTAHDGWLLCEQVHFIRSDGSFCEKGPETVDKCVHCFMARHPELPLADHVPRLFHDLALRRQCCQSVLRHIDILLVPSRFIGKAMAAHGLDHPGIITAPLGIRPFQPLPWQRRNGPVRFGFLGSIYYTKGIDVLMRAFDLIDPDTARLDLFGNIVDPVYFRHLMSRVGASHKIEYHGRYTPKDLPEILSKIDAAVIPSRCESFSIVARECLHARVPVIASRVGGLPEAVEDGKNGLLFQSEDHEDLARKLAFFARSPEQVALFRRRIKPVRTIAEDAAQIESIYRYALSSKGRSSPPDARMKHGPAASAHQATSGQATPLSVAAAPATVAAQASPSTSRAPWAPPEQSPPPSPEPPSHSTRHGRKPHILFTMAGWHEDAGGTQLPRQIAETLADRGYRISVIATRSSGARGFGQCQPYEVHKSGENGVELLAIHHPQDSKTNLEHSESGMDDPFMRRLIARLVVKSEPDVVHYHSLHNFSLGTAEVIHRLGIPSVYTSHNYWPICPRMYLFRPDMSVCDGPSEDGSRCASCTGRMEKRDLYKERIRLGRQILNRCIQSHVTVSQRARQIFIENGCEASRIHALPIQSKISEDIWARLGRTRQPEGALRRPLRIGFLGNLFAWKGIHVLMEALEPFQAGQIECHIFGDGSKSYTDKLRQMDKRNLARFHGGYSLSRLPDLLGVIDVAVSPSICEETGGLVVIEALAGRVPVIGSRIGGIPELIRDGVTGILFSAGDARELAGALRRFVENPDLLGAMQARIEPPRGFGAYVDELAAHYENVIAAHARRG